MVVVEQAVDLRHHGRAVDAGRERVHGDLRFLAARAHLLADLPRLRAVDLAHRALLEAAAGEHHAADLVARRHLVVDLVDHLARGGVGRRVRLLERRLAGGVEPFVHGEDALLGDRLRDRPRDRLARVQERVFTAHAFRDVAAVERLDHAVHRAEQDAALAEDVRLVLALERRLERVRRAERHRPAERDVRRAPVDVLLHREARVDAGAVHLFALYVQAPHARPHALRAHGDDVDVARELRAHVLEVTEQEAVRETERDARAQVLEHLAEELRLSGVRDQEQHEVRLAHHLEHLPERAVRLGEARLLGGLRRARARAQADLHLDAGALERVTQVLSLRRALRAPADDADLLDARERLREQGEQVAAAAHDLLRVRAELELVDGEDLGREGQCFRHGDSPGRGRGERRSGPVRPRFAGVAPGPCCVKCMVWDYLLRMTQQSGKVRIFRWNTTT